MDQITRKFTKLLLVMMVILAGGFMSNANAQSGPISGTVKDTNGIGLPGVNVTIKGTTQGTITDMDGNYSINGVDANATLVFSFVGYNTQEIAVAGQTSISPVLEEETVGLDDVVVVGYGVVKKRDLTGSVSSIKSDDIQKTASSNAMQAMQAKIPGLDIQQSSGESGSSVSMNLRGKRSINASNNPLILVDGVEYGSTLDINPSDIESMEVLKDASSTAIYGTRGANGVIIITTKRGKAGKTNVNVNAFWSSNQPTNIPEVMYGDKEVQRMVDERNYKADLESGNWGSSKATASDVLAGYTIADGTTAEEIYNEKSYTDWGDIILQNGLTQNYEVSVNGGSENTNFAISVGAMFEEGLMDNDKLNRYNAKANIDHKINDMFKVGTSLLYTFKDHNKRNASVFNQSLKMTTITHAYLNDGTINAQPNPWYAAHCNPLLDEVDGAFQNNIESTRFFGNVYLEVTPIKGLVFKSLFALDRSDSRNGLYQDYESVARYQSPATGYISNVRSNSTAFTWDNTINYNTDFNGSKNNLNVLVGTSAKKDINESMTIEGDCGREHYKISSFYDVLKIGSTVTKSSYSMSSLMSVFGRLNYSYAGKYLLSATLRADGSSVLAEGNKWGYFPSVAAGWRISDEDFMAGSQDVLSNLKLRASWGVAGNAAIDPYQTVTSLSDKYIYYDESNTSGKIPGVMGNKELTWETTKSWNIGLDFGFLNNRISGTFDIFQSKTTDLLYAQSASATTGFPNAMANIGETKGSGIELSLNTLVIDKDFKWDINWSFSSAKDEIVSLSNGVDRNISGNSGQIVGEQVSIFYDYEQDGCWGVGEFEQFKSEWATRHQGVELAYMEHYGDPGTIKLIDKNDDGKIDDDDKIVYNRDPKAIFGMNNNFSYKDLSLSVLLYARTGGYISYDMNTQIQTESANWGNLDYWTVDNQGARTPAPGSNSSLIQTYKNALSYEKANYVKIKDITLSYNLPSTILEKAHLGSAKIYCSLKNFVTFSNIDNYDPERGGSISFPLAKQVVFGLNLQF
jgi:TonB-linked SusC/RagA family outer membrane protein